MGAPTLIIAGVTLPQRSRLDYQQTFERLDGGATTRRLANGAAFTMQHWERWGTTISGGGWIPPALLGIQRGVPFEIHSVYPLSLKPGESLPTGWTARTDFPEQSVTDENGVTVRLVLPILTVISPLGARYVVGGANPQWEMVCEEA